jgi:hypothetical protein
MRHAGIGNPAGLGENHMTASTANGNKAANAFRALNVGPVRYRGIAACSWLPGRGAGVLEVDISFSLRFLPPDAHPIGSVISSAARFPSTYAAPDKAAPTI